MVTKDYFSDLEGFGSGPSLPSPSDTPYQTPRMSNSRRSSRHASHSRNGSSSPPLMPSSSPPPMPGSSPATNGDDYKSNSHRHDDDVLTDPRRFTPTLHASLVSEILNVRRELDSKHKFIEDLEVNLKNARDESDELNEKLAASDKDRRQLKRQFQQLEHGTLAALEELAKDRDGAKSTCTDMKNKLDVAQKKIKSQEEDSERRHAIWEKEKHAWEAEKRGYERRVHITETRLKTVLEELAAHHEATELQANGADGEDDDGLRDSGIGDDQSETASAQCSPMRRIKHHRSPSTSSRRSLNRFQRFSAQSASCGDVFKGNGISLADELQLDEEDEDFEDEEQDDDFPQHEIKTRRGLDSRQSQHQDDETKGILGLMSENRMGGLQQPIDLEGRRFQDQNGSIDFRLEARLVYVNTGVQFSPPPSPVVTAVVKDMEKLPEMAPISYDDQIEANQRKKRVTVSPPPVIDRGQQMSPIPDEKPSKITMVSSAVQTIEDRPTSPPATPKIITPPTSPTVAALLQPKIEVASMSTQTDPTEEPRSPAFFDNTPLRTRALIPGPILIPSIAIHPPMSAPNSPTFKEAVLPPGTKNVSCQTTPFTVTTESIGIQTEEIRTDKRLWQKLPPHLHPSFVNSNPPTPDGKQRSVSDKSPMNRPGFYSPRSGSPAPDHFPSSPPPMPSPKGIEHRYPGNNDNGPLNGEGSAPRRPFRESSLFAGFEDDEEETELPQPSFQTPFSSGRLLKHVRSLGTRPSPVPEEKETGTTPPNQQDQNSSGRDSLEKSRTNGKQKATSMRRSAMIQSGAAAHAHRSRTPSICSIGSSRLSNGSVGPPFPVPDRASSRKLFSHSKSEGSSSPTPRSGGGLFGQRRGPIPRQLVRKDSLRKVRSATTIQRNNSRGRNRSRSPPLNQPASPSFPPLPKDDGAEPHRAYPSQRSGEKLLAAEMTDVNGKTEGGRASQGTVIDAIAATMVGEWMFKYVRRRKSFGVAGDPDKESIGRPGTDGSVNVTGNGVRHKRWVWLSPYERAVMWSTKQPSSNSALMGKSGRKLIIQSVLDVRDDTPLPKNHGIAEPFNRSILILTPARALKFSAMSSDRHYSWLTALSFLAHSPLLAPGVSSLPPPSDEPTEAELIARGNRQPSIRRQTIRDSVRVAKDKARTNPNGNPKIPPVPSIQEFHSSPIGPSSAMVTSGGLDCDPIADAAQAPIVPRFAHGRKRSHTGPRMPSSALRNLQYTQVSMPSYASQASSDYGSGARDFSFIASSGRTSVASTSRSPLVSNFPEGGVGTVRMEAFVEGEGDGPRPSQDSSVLGVGRDSRRNSRWSGSGSDPRRSGMVYSEEFDAFDPFRGF